MHVVAWIPLEVFGRFAAFVFFYFVGLRSLDIHGMIQEGSTLVRPDVLAVFAREPQCFLVSFFNNVSFVGEFATLAIRSWWDAAFVMTNVVARFFGVFLVVNAAFLRLSVLATQSALADDGRQESGGREQEGG